METFWKQKKQSNQFLETDTKYLVKINNYYYFCFRYNQRIIKVSLKSKSLYQSNIKKIQLIKRLRMSEDFKNYFNMTNNTFGVQTTSHIDEDPEEVERLNQKIRDLINQEKKNGNIKSIKKIDIETDSVNQITIKEAFENFIKEKEDEIGESSKRRYTTFYKYILLFCNEDKLVHTFTEDFFKKMLSKVKVFPGGVIGLKKYKYMKYDDIMKDFQDTEYNKLKGKYINDMFEAYFIFFDYFKYENYIKSNVVVYRKQKEETDSYIPYSNEDIKLIFDTFKDKKPLINDIVKIGLYTGMRIGEISEIEKDNIDFKNNLIRITKSKTKAGIRVIPIHKDILNIIQFHYDNTDKFLFSKDGNKNQLNKLYSNNVRKIISEKKKTFHSLRKNFTQQLYKKQQQNLVQENTIDRLLGHKVDSLSFDIYNLNEIDINILRDTIDMIDYNDFMGELEVEGIKISL